MLRQRSTRYRSHAALLTRGASTELVGKLARYPEVYDLLPSVRACAHGQMLHPRSFALGCCGVSRREKLAGRGDKFVAASCRSAFREAARLTSALGRLVIEFKLIGINLKCVAGLWSDPAAGPE
jgi:hypothetical protein